MVPLEQMEHEHAQRAFQLVVLLLAHVVDLLRDRRGVDLREPAGAQKLGLTERPGVEIGLFRDGPLRLLTDRVPGHRLVSLKGPQLKATFSALSGSSWPKHRW